MSETRNTPPTAKSSGRENLRGTYGYQFTGTIPIDAPPSRVPPWQLYASVGHVEFDPKKGRFTGSGALNHDGAAAGPPNTPPIPATGTYDVFPDGSGTMTFDNPLPGIGTVVLYFVLVDEGKEIFFLLMQPTMLPTAPPPTPNDPPVFTGRGGVVTGIAKRV